jgi:iron complex transport system ATP-binding protein
MSALVADAIAVVRGARSVLSAFSLQAERGSVTALAGPNGAGKSSALKALAGLLPCSGGVSVLGRPLRELSLLERARAMAYVPQQSLLQRALPVRDVVAQGRYAHDPVWPLRKRAADDGVARGRGAAAATHGGVTSGSRAEAIDRAMQLTQVQELASRRWDELSGGEQRRVLLARALATEAPIVLLDEPTASLDAAHALRFLQLLRTLAASGQCVIVVLHDLEQVRRFADSVVLLDRGRTVASGAARDVITAGFIREVYGVELIENAALGFRLLGSESP